MNMVEKGATAILAKVPPGYGMTKAEAADYARAVIEAMKEPTPVMMDANWAAIRNVDPEQRMWISLMSSADAHHVKAKCRWHAMITAALSEESTS